MVIGPVEVKRVGKVGKAEGGTVSEREANGSMGASVCLGEWEGCEDKVTAESTEVG